MGKEICCLLVCCIYHVSAYDKNHMSNDDATYGTEDVEGFGHFPYTEPPLRPFSKGPPSVAFIIIDVQVR